MNPEFIFNIFLVLASSLMLIVGGIFILRDGLIMGGISIILTGIFFIMILISYLKNYNQPNQEQ